ncbi:hypothetical protein PAXRUDRAFT_585824 [Paxillus rubicundulus Ve08.2h10]|uniref:Uncharacterized protein n=1 Tax=Paxillus rubicundulus Ve08.2h10 TaxID=930991 RepID=A0A0D0D660_9AGAM|nr:hypothetical protein PAXRUDRAFT_585824 [Paxillus rubicundulus Ve08.2h10]
MSLCSSWLGGDMIPWRSVLPGSSAERSTCINQPFIITLSCNNIFVRGQARHLDFITSIHGRDSVVHHV